MARRKLTANQIVKEIIEFGSTNIRIRQVTHDDDGIPYGLRHVS